MAKRRGLALFIGAVLLWSSVPFPFRGPVPVSARPDELEWSVVDTPSEEGHVVVNPSEVNGLVVASEDIFYAIDIPGETLYKSTDGGVSWEDDATDALREAEPAGAELPVWDIAVAPDDPDLVAVVTDARQEVYVSEDGGESWKDTHLSDATGWDVDLLIADIAISPKYAGERDIAIGTRKPDGVTNGDIWVIRSRAFGTWEAQGLNMDVTSVRFSPDYENDGAVLVIASTASYGDPAQGRTFLCTGIRNTGENSTNWNLSDLPKVDISEATDDSPSEDGIISSDLALPPQYSADDKATRLLYAAYHANSSADDAYRIEDTDVFRLKVKRGGKASLASIAYHRGTILAGEVRAKAKYASALVHICFQPNSDNPEWLEPLQPPTGGFGSGRAYPQVAAMDGHDPETDEARTYFYCATSTSQVTSAADWADTGLPGAWSGNAATDPDESALSRSEDEGHTWNQLSLIDTDMSKLCDYALSDDYECLYLASVGTGFDSLWRSQTEPLGEAWQRILCLDSEDNEIRLEATPEDSPEQAVFFAVLDSYDCRYSFDRGRTWEKVRDCAHITEFAVADNERIYILDDNLLNKGTWNEERRGGIWEWDRDIDTGLLSGHSIALSGHCVFVGDKGDEGKVAYSLDGGMNFTLTQAVPEPGKMVMVADEDFDRNRLLYAASDETLSDIYRCVVRDSVSWEKLNSPEMGFYGLAQKAGALYGAYGPGVARTLIPRMDTVDEIDWDRLRLGLTADVAFKSGTLEAAVRDKDVELWAIDDRDYDFSSSTGCLWIYSDIFVLQTPWPTSPAIGEAIPCDPCACQASVFCFWWRRMPLTLQYELWIALDEEFNYVLAKIEDITPDDLCDPGWCSCETAFRFVCGKTYYWKVRSCTVTEGERIHSRWSPPMAFTVKAGTTTGGAHIAPMLKVPESGSQGVPRSPVFSWIGFPGTTEYEFILAEDDALTQVLTKKKVSTSAYVYEGELDWGKTYVWQVTAVKPAPSDSATGTFTVMPEPQPIATPPEISLASPPPPSTPLWVWLLLGILALLATVVIVLCFTTRR